MTNEELLDIYEELMMELVILNEDVPKLQKLHKDAQADMERTISMLDAGLKNFRAEGDRHKMEMSDMSEEARNTFLKTTMPLLQNLTDGMTKMKEIQDGLDAADEQLEALNQKVGTVQKKQTDLENSIIALQNTIMEMENRLQGFHTQNIGSAEKNDAPQMNGQKLAIDYGENGTMEDLYQKYRGIINGPVTVVRMNWNNDFCFTITSEAATHYNGFCFANGHFWRESTYKKNTDNCSLYHGPSEAAIKKYYKENYGPH